MRKPLLVTMGLLAAVVGSAVLMFKSPAALEVKTIAVQRGPIQSIIRMTGRVINDRTVTLTALLDGQVEGMLVQKGDSVAAGQVLAYLDKREADAQLSKAQAVVARERDSVEQLTRKLKRLSKVSRVGGESIQAVDDSETALSTAQAQLRVAEADLRIAQILREKVNITAPFGGVITEKATEVGQWVEAGTKLLTLVANQGREIEANLDAADSALVAIGQSVDISCDAFPTQSWKETVHWIAPALTADDKDAINSFAVRMSLGTEAAPLLLGQQVDATITTAQRENVLKLPYGALIDNDDGTHKVAVIDNGQVRFLPVEVGIEDLTHIEIKTGLKADMTVILPEGKTLKAGAAVIKQSGDSP